MKEPKFIDLNNYKSQGNMVVDMCVACILHERKFGMPLKAIILNASYFDQFRSWVIENYGEQHAYDEFLIDTVEIKKEILYSGERLRTEYYKQTQEN